MRGLRKELKSRKNNPLMLFNSAIFCKLAVLKKHSLCLVEIELSVPFSPHFANTFSVVAKSAPLLSPQRSRGLHPLLVPPLRGLRTTSGFVKFSNLEQVRIWNFTNPRERYMLCCYKRST